MQDNEKKPALRFKGFTDPWEQRKLGEICDFITKGATPTTYGFSWQPDGVPFFRNDSIKDNVFVFGEFSYISEAANEVLKRSEVHGNDILIAITGDIGKVGIIPDTVEKANINQHIARVRIRKEALPYFVYQYLASDDTQKEYQKIKTGLSMPQLSLEQVRDIVVKIPEFNEQGKIADCLRRIDTLITLHQRKYEKLVNIKKSMLDKMFPQNGASVPEIRFKGFTDPWEQRKLAELTKTITTGKSVNSDEGEVSDGDIGVLKTSCVSYDRFNPSESKPVVKSEQQLVKCAVEKDSVIVSRMNTPERVGACGYVSTDFPNLFLPDRLWKLKFQDTVDTYFVYMMLVSSAYKEKITSMASGTSGSMYNIPKETFLNLQLVIPAKIDEQKQLGKILKKIDTLITLHQRKLEKLQNIKKSCLEKMFV